jgi:tripartite-type tricarboxylate transporter receptor subunit TctC
LGGVGLWPGAPTPEPIIKTLNEHIVAIVAMPDYRALIENAGSIAIAATPQEFSAVMQKTLDDVTPAVQEFGLQQDQ